MNKLQWDCNWNSNIFIEENAFESVFCEMAAMLFRSQCVKELMATFYIGFWLVVIYGGDSSIEQKIYNIYAQICKCLVYY